MYDANLMSLHYITCEQLTDTTPSSINMCYCFRMLGKFIALGMRNFQANTFPVRLYKHKLILLGISTYKLYLP